MAKLYSASLILTPSPSAAVSSRAAASFKPPPPPPPPHVQQHSFSSPASYSRGGRRRRLVVTRAGPTTSQYVFAFLLPLSLIGITVFASIRIADKLDRDYLEEVAINRAIRETDDDEDDDEVDNMSSEDKSATGPRTRNRPKREV